MADEAEQRVKEAYDEVTKEWLIRVTMEKWLRTEYGWQALDRWWSKKDQLVEDMRQELDA